MGLIGAKIKVLTVLLSEVLRGESISLPFPVSRSHLFSICKALNSVSFCSSRISLSCLLLPLFRPL